MGLPLTHRYWLLLGASFAWLALIVIPAWLSEAGFPIFRVLHLIFAPICHQIPERSFAWGETTIGVCHRCFGVYSGFVAGVLVWPRIPRPATYLLAHSRLLWLFLGILVVDVVLPNQAWDRVASGFLVGFPAALFVWVAAEQFPGGRTRAARIEPTSREPDGSEPDLAGVANVQRSVP